MKYETLPWLILFLPLFAATVITLFTLSSRNLSALISIGAIVAGFIMTVTFIAANGFNPLLTETSRTWMTIGNLQVDFGLKLDA
jgi:NADH:ubiquinone oxidoreductase subunit 5 (subunit L)/multisubunit Na+/H+ antiporter MnhA subunit